MKSKVSAVVTSYNRKYEARRALETIYRQSRLPDEIIFVDDASKDGTKAYIMDRSFPNLTYISHNTRCGPGASRNTGIDAASGDYIAFLDSDNIWYPDKVETFLEEIDSGDKEVDVWFSSYKQHITNRVEEYPQIPQGVNVNRYARAYGIADASATFYKRSFLKEIGGFSQVLWTNLDYELLLRASQARNVEVKKIDRCLSENYCMFDGLEADGLVKYRDRIKLYSTYYDRIKGEGMHTKFYEGLQQELGLDGLSLDALLEYMLEEGSMTKEFIYTMTEFSREQERKKYTRAVRRADFYRLMSNWMELNLKGGSLKDTLVAMGISSAAVYGAGRHGRFLYQDLKKSGFDIRYFIDRNQNVCAPDGLSVYLPTEDIPEVDAILVSVYREFEEIAKALQEHRNCKIFSLDRLLRDALENV